MLNNIFTKKSRYVCFNLETIIEYALQVSKK